MHEALSAKRTETDRKQTTSAQKPSRAKQPLQRTLDSKRLPLYMQAWGDRPPPWLRLSTSLQVPDEQLVQRQEEENQQGEQLHQVNGQLPVFAQETPQLQRMDAAHLPLYTQAQGNQPPPWLHLRSPQQAFQEGDPLQRTAEPTQQKEDNTGLPDTLKAGIETLSSLSMDDVHVHYHSSKPAEVQALAYTQGTDIHVGPGQEKHLAHEAWHVVQQKQGRVMPTMQAKGMAINDDQGLEKEADVMGGRADQASSVSRQGEEISEGDSVKERPYAARSRGYASKMVPIQGYFEQNQKRIKEETLREILAGLEAVKAPNEVIIEFGRIANDGKSPQDIDRWLAQKQTGLTKVLTLQQILANAKAPSQPKGPENKKLTPREALLSNLDKALAEAKSQRNVMAEPNIAYAQINITTSSNEKIVGNRIANSGKYSAEGTVKIPNPDRRYFKIGYANNYYREFDSEVKIFEQLASQIGNDPKAFGRVELYSNLPICSSCQDVIRQFREYYKKIEVIVKKEAKQVTEKNIDIVNKIYPQEALKAYAK